MNLKKLLKREIIITIVTITLIATTFFLVSYAVYLRVDEHEVGTVSTGGITFEMCTDQTCSDVEDLATIITGDLYPMNNAEGVALTPYTFVLTNQGDTTLEATIYATTFGDLTLDYSDVRMAAKESTEVNYTMTDFETDIINIKENITLTAGQSKIIYVLVWGNEELSNELIGESFNAFINAVAYYYPEDGNGLYETYVANIDSDLLKTKEITYAAPTENNPNPYEEYTVPVTGWYQIEAWGAAGQDGTITSGGYGGYTSGKIYLEQGEKLYVYVGGKPIDYNTGGYNGGGTGVSNNSIEYGTPGGGSTDIRYFETNPQASDLVSNSSIGLNSRIMVAGGGGGNAGWNSSANAARGGNGGGLLASNGNVYCASCARAITASTAGTQISGGSGGQSQLANGTGASGIFGIGGSASPYPHGGGGGGGYYGGGGGAVDGATVGSGAGGSSFISGYAGSAAIIEGSIGDTREHIDASGKINTLHYSGKYFVDGEMQAGVRSGNGQARITYLGTTSPTRINTALNNVRYIKDCATGNPVDGHVRWDEIQAIDTNGTNVAFGKNIIDYTVDEFPGYPYSRITDGLVAIVDIHAGTLTNAQGTNRCVTVDLGATYNLNEIAVWHMASEIYPTYQPYYGNTTYVSATGSADSWVPIIASEEAETSQGKRISAYDQSTTVVPIYRLTNMVENASFEDGTTNWSNSTSGSFASVASSASANGSYIAYISAPNASSHVAIKQSVSIIANHKYYGRIKILRTVPFAGANSGTGQYDIVNFSISGEMDLSPGININTIPDANTWYTFSKISNGLETFDANLRVFTYNTNQLFLDSLLLIDLTSTFGVGNEPSKEWCDANIPFFEGSQTFSLDY